MSRISSTGHRIYFYPKTDYKAAMSPNPYAEDFEKAISTRNRIVNKKLNQRGILDLFLHFPKADIYILNWIENLTHRRFGFIQAILLFCFMPLARFFGKKVVWVMHNKYAHTGKSRLTDSMFRLLMKYSTVVLTHSEGGIEYIRHKYPKYIGKARHIIHPTKMPFSYTKKKTNRDLLIWGTISKYKGVLDFLEHVSTVNNTQDLVILLVGKCTDDKTLLELRQYINKNIRHIDRFYKLEEIASLAQESRFILFTYREESVFASGALMDSLRMGTNIIGPNFGAFKDLVKYNLIENYDSFDDIIKICNHTDHKYSPNRFEKFCDENSWSHFSDKIQEILNQITHQNHSLQSKNTWQTS